MAKDEAKNKVIDVLAKAFGDKWVGKVDKKYYVWSEEDGLPKQVCITLTCPKVAIQSEGVSIENDTPTFSAPTAEITKDEKDNIEALMVSLGL